MSKTKGFAVTGNPILHSKSPWIFNTLFKSHSECAVFNRLAATTPIEAVQLFKQMELHGMTVTAPFKEEIGACLDSVDKAATAIGGVNTIVKHNNGLKGYNTDYIGVVQSLKKRHIQIKNTRSLVLGAGGAGRSAAYGLIEEGADVTIVNRTFSKADQVADRLGCRTGKIENLNSLLQSSDILISTLPADVNLIHPGWLKKGLVILDANYKRSGLKPVAIKKGCIFIDGEDWLIQQAIPAYQHFCGYKPDDSVLESTGITHNNLGINQKKIFIVGFMGSGKSTIGRLLAKKMDFSFLDTDEIIQEKQGESIPAIFEGRGETYFRQREKSVLQELRNQQSIVCSCGGGAVIDSENRDILRDNSLVVWLFAPTSICIQRFPQGTRPLLEGGNLRKNSGKIFQERFLHYATVADLIVNSHQDKEIIVDKIYEEITKTFSY